MSAPQPTISNLWPESLLGQGLNLDVQVAASYSLFTVPAGVTGAVITRVAFVLKSGDPSVTGDDSYTLTSPATAGINDWSNPGSLFINFNPGAANLQQVAVLQGGNAGTPKALYLPADVFQMVTGGGTDAATFDVYVYGFLVP